MKRFIQLTVCIAILTSVLSGCKKESERLPPALEEEIALIDDCMCLPYFAKYSWRGEIVYLAFNRGASCSSRPRYYNKNGINIEMETGYSLTDFMAEATLIGLVWECIDALT